MTLRVATSLGFLALLLPFVTAHWSRRHQEVAHRARDDVDIYKRQSFTNARFTFYDVGLGACGQYNIASDWIVALNVDQYGSGYPGPQCFKTITIQYGGMTAQATIMDECMGCPYGGLDFSRGLFDYFASESLGVLYGTWWFNDGSGGGGGGDQPSSSSPTWEPPTTSSTPDYTPPPATSTADYTPQPTSSAPAYTPPPTTSTQSTIPPSSPTSSHSSVPPPTSSLSVVAIPTGSMVPVPNSSNPENIPVINNLMVEIGIVLLAAEKEV